MLSLCVHQHNLNQSLVFFHLEWVVLDTLYELFEELLRIFVFIPFFFNLFFSFTKLFFIILLD